MYMEPTNISPEPQFEQKKNVLTSVTPLSKYLAMGLFILMPFVGGWVGYKSAPEKVIEVEKFVIKDVHGGVENSADKTVSVATTANAQRSKIAEATNYVFVACLANKYTDSSIVDEIDVWAGGLIENGTLKADTYSKLNDIARQVPQKRMYQNGVEAKLQTCFDYAKDLSDEILLTNIY